jgi:hypothetical protein
MFQTQGYFQNCPAYWIASAGMTYWWWRLITANLLVQTRLDQLLLLNKTIITILQNANLMGRATVLSPPIKLVFPGRWYSTVTKLWTSSKEMYYYCSANIKLSSQLPLLQHDTVPWHCKKQAQLFNFVFVLDTWLIIGGDAAFNKPNNSWWCSLVTK